MQVHLGRAATSGSHVWWLCVQVQNATPDLSQNPFEFLKQSSKEDAQAAKDEVRTRANPSSFKPAQARDRCNLHHGYLTLCVANWCATCAAISPHIIAAAAAACLVHCVSDALVFPSKAASEGWQTQASTKLYACS